MKKFTFIDLFSGIGGFRLALERNGGECIGFSEINKDAITYYCKNYKEEDNSNFGDITKIKSLSFVMIPSLSQGSLMDESPILMIARSVC